MCAKYCQVLGSPGFTKSFPGKFAMRIRDWMRPTVDVPEGLEVEVLGSFTWNLILAAFSERSVAHCRTRYIKALQISANKLLIGSNTPLHGWAPFLSASDDFTEDGMWKGLLMLKAWRSLPNLGPGSFTQLFCHQIPLWPSHDNIMKHIVRSKPRAEYAWYFMIHHDTMTMIYNAQQSTWGNFVLGLFTTLSHIRPVNHKGVAGVWGNVCINLREK